MKALVVGVLAVVGLASAAHAQSIAGTVRDESGAVLPGVTVEAASPALIEKTRTAVTDSSGQYRIVSLSPGVYTVTFSLPGFSTVRRDGIELTGNFTATVNGDLKVGALEETITVSGASPLVDVQSLTRQTVFTREVLDALPAAHNIQSAAVMVPGVTVSGLVGTNVFNNDFVNSVTRTSRRRPRTSSCGRPTFCRDGCSSSGGRSSFRPRRRRSPQKALRTTPRNTSALRPRR